MFQTSVTFIIFNRPVHTKKTFEIIRKIKPPKLFIIADGPRLNFPEDKKKCLDARNVISDIDWPCEIFKNYEASIHSAKITTLGEKVEDTFFIEDLRTNLISKNKMQKIKKALAEII